MAAAMTQTQVIGLIGGLLASLFAAAIIATVRWVRRQFQPIVQQLTPNGGSSAIDKIHALSDDFTEYKKDTARRFDDVDKHLDRQDRRIDGLYRPDHGIIR